MPAIEMSFEFFPPKTDAAEELFWASLHRLAPLEPRFVSVTYGAGGSTRERTLRMVTSITERTGIKAAAHLTCVGASRAEVDAVIEAYGTAGIGHIVAIRGDPPEGPGSTFVPHPQGYASGADLVAAIARRGAFEISVAAYPEKHPESLNWDTDLANLKRKFDNGASRAITQMFFDNDFHWSFLERAARAGISAPIVPGIQPIHNFAQVKRFASRCGASIPAWLADRFEGLGADHETHALVAASIAAEQVAELMDGGVTEFHFYTMNRSALVYALARTLGRRPESQARES
ncbi:MAG: methylenetetrahydrofolate reductase [NAD(P)H] [Cucumibacter sp.]